MARFCTKCGKPLKGEGKFCTNCGAPRADGGVQPPVQKPAAAPAQQPAPAPAQTPAATPVRQPAPAPAQKPAVAPVRRPAPPPVPPSAAAQPPKKKGKAGLIVGIVVACLLLIAIAAVGLHFLLIGRDKPVEPPEETLSVETAEPAPEVTTLPTVVPSVTPSEAPTPYSSGEPLPSQVPAGTFDPALMEGIYYCADIEGAGLEFYSSGNYLDIYKYYSFGNLTDINTTIAPPTETSFSIDYQGRSIEFFYSEANRSVTVVENGTADVYTLDGNLSWPDESADPFTDPDGYILPTDTRLIEESELYGMDAEQVKLARNEIYARHGYSFTMDKFRDYFSTKNWYHEDTSVNANSFGTAQMNEFERANVDIIKAYESKMGW